MVWKVFLHQFRTWYISPLPMFCGTEFTNMVPYRCRGLGNESPQPSSHFSAIQWTIDYMDHPVASMSKYKWGNGDNRSLCAGSLSPLATNGNFTLWFDISLIRFSIHILQMLAIIISSHTCLLLVDSTFHYLTVQKEMLSQELRSCLSMRLTFNMQNIFIES